MIDVRAAVAEAKRRLRELYDESETRDLLLEEVMLTEDGRHWNVTLGFSTPITTPRDEEMPTNSPMMKSLSHLVPPKFERKYKQFRIASETGAFEGMSMRL